MDGKAIGNRIKALRCYRGMTQDDLAERVNVSKFSIVRWEKGNIPSVWEELKLIATALGTTSDYIKNGVPIKEETPDLKKAYDVVIKSRYFSDFLSCVLRGSACEDFKSLDIERKNARDCAEKLFDDAEYSIHEV